MKWQRILGGGVVAGLVIVVGELVIEPLMGPMMERFLSRLGLPAPGEQAMLALVATMLALGIATVWLYAAIAPKYGAGMRTALIAGVVVWALSCLAPNITLVTFGVFDTRLFWFASAWPLVEHVVAAIAGAKVYRGRSAGTVPVGNGGAVASTR